MTAVRLRTTRDAEFASAVFFGYFLLLPKESNATVDVSSGIETDGRKDFCKMATFAKVVRRKFL